MEESTAQIASTASADTVAEIAKQLVSAVTASQKPETVKPVAVHQTLSPVASTLSVEERLTTLETNHAQLLVRLHKKLGQYF